jgi:hypothetical protein
VVAHRRGVRATGFEKAGPEGKKAMGALETGIYCPLAAVREGRHPAKQQA